MRSPTEIFEEVVGLLDPAYSAAAYREEFRRALIHGPTVKTCAFLVLEDYGQHPVPCGVPAPNYLGMDGLPRCDRHATGARRVTPWPADLAPPLPTASAEEAFRGDPEIYRGQLMQEPAPLPPTKEEVWATIDRCSRKTYDFWQDVKSRESVAERAERLAERYTRPDGSER